MRHAEHQYLDLLRKVVEEGDPRQDRTGVGTKAIFGAELRFDLSQGFPAYTTKKVYWRTAVRELLLFLNGATDLRAYLEQKVHIWTDWPLKKYRDATGERVTQEEFEARILGDAAFSARWGDLGPIYGKQWRRWKTADGREIDQVEQVIHLLKTDPTSRRILWDGWNVGELDKMALPPCHKHYQFFVNLKRGTLSGACIQRSCDLLLGNPFNIVSLAMVTHLLAEHTGYAPGEIVWYGLDTHVYSNHADAVATQLAREPKPFPKLQFRQKRASLYDYRSEDFELVGYDPHPPIKADVAV